MSPLDLNAIPNPPNSPIEKLLPDTMWENIEPRIRDTLSENPTKDEILRAFSYYDRVLADYIQRHEQAMTYWANTHTHAGGVGGNLPYLPAPAHWSIMFGVVDGDYYSAGSGLSWDQPTVQIGNRQGGYFDITWTGTYFIAVQGHRGQFVVVSEDLQTIVYDSPQQTALNQRYYQGCATNEDGSVVVLAGGQTNASVDIAYNLGDPSVALDWNHITIDTTGGRCSNVIHQDGTWYAASPEKVYASTDAVVWNVISSVPESPGLTNYGPFLTAFAGRLFYYLSSGVTVSSSSSLWVSDDNGATWEKHTDAWGAVEGPMRVAGASLLVPKRLPNRELLLSTDGVTFTNVPFTGTPLSAGSGDFKIGQVADNGSIVLRDEPKMWASSTNDLTSWTEATIGVGASQALI